MDLEARLRAFAAFARRRSFSAAARELRISQPAVSKHIAEVERETQDAHGGLAGHQGEADPRETAVPGRPDGDREEGAAHAGTMQATKNARDEYGGDEREHQFTHCVSVVAKV